MAEFEARIEAEHKALELEHEAMMQEKIAEVDAARKAARAALGKERLAAATTKEEQDAIRAELKKEEEEEEKRMKVQMQRDRQDFEAELASKKEQARTQEADRLNNEIQNLQAEARKEKINLQEKLAAEKEQQNARVQELAEIACKRFLNAGLKFASTRQIGMDVAVKKLRKLYSLGAPQLHKNNKKKKLGGKISKDAEEENPLDAGEGSVFMEKLKGLESTVQKLISGPDDGQFNNVAKGYVDEVEAGFVCTAPGSKAKPLQAKALSAKQYVAVKFGESIFEFLNCNLNQVYLYGSTL
jgi:hypothetical protein